MKTFQIEGSNLYFRELNDPEEVSFELAASVARLLADAYAGRFEEPAGKLPEGTFKDFFGVGGSPDTISSRAKRMRSHMAHGSTYCIASEQPNYSFEVTGGLAKTSAYRTTKLQKARLQSPNCYLNDIVVAPTVQGAGVGKALLRGVLTSGRFDMRRSLTLDGFEDHHYANAWFKRLGMHVVEGAANDFEVDVPSSDPFESWGQNARQYYWLPQLRYTSEGEATLEGIVGKLERANSPN